MSGMSAIDIAIQEAMKAKAALDNAIRAITPPAPITPTPNPAKVTCPKDVFILWTFNKHNPRAIVGVYSTKIEAEHDMRVLVKAEDENEKVEPYQPRFEYDIQVIFLNNNRVD